MGKRGPGRKKEFVGDDELVSRRYDLPLSMADEIDKHSDELKIKKTHFVRRAIKHYTDSKLYVDGGMGGCTVSEEELRQLVEILERYMGVAGLGYGSIEIIENCIWEWEREKGHKKKEAIKLLAKQLGKIYDYFQDNPEAIRIYVKILLITAEEQ